MSPHRRDVPRDGPGEARQYSAGLTGGRGPRSGGQSASQSHRNPLRILYLRIVAEVLEAGYLGRGPQLENGVQDPLGGDRIDHHPGELKGPLPVPERAVPAFGVPKPLPHVGDRLVVQRSPAAGADQGPLILGLLIGERMGGREYGAELLAEEALAGEAREERADRAAEDPLGEGGARRALDHRAVEEERAPDLHLQGALEIARHQLGRDRSAHVVGDQDYIGLVAAPQQLLHQVGLPVQRVALVARLLGEPEPEEVGGDHAVLGLPIEEEAPVVGARWEAVEEDEKWIAAAAPEHVDAAAAELLLAPALAPRGNPGG